MPLPGVRAAPRPPDYHYRINIYSSANGGRAAPITGMHTPPGGNPRPARPRGQTYASTERAKYQRGTPGGWGWPQGPKPGLGARPGGGIPAHADLVRLVNSKTVISVRCALSAMEQHYLLTLYIYAYDIEKIIFHSGSHGFDGGTFTEAC